MTKGGLGKESSARVDKNFKPAVGSGKLQHNFFGGCVSARSPKSLLFSREKTTGFLDNIFVCFIYRSLCPQHHDRDRLSVCHSCLHFDSFYRSELAPCYLQLTNSRSEMPKIKNEANGKQ